jgi:hypothetical protein
VNPETIYDVVAYKATETGQVEAYQAGSVLGKNWETARQGFAGPANGTCRDGCCFNHDGEGPLAGFIVKLHPSDTFTEVMANLTAGEEGWN